MSRSVPGLVAVLFFILVGCSKDDDEIQPPSKTDFATFLKGTEWVGTLDRTGFEYPLPLSVKFNSDNTFTMYSLFLFFDATSEITKDSIVGNINSIDSLPDGRTRINTSIITSFRNITTTAIYFTDRKEIMGISSNTTEPPTFQASLFPSERKSVNGEWSGAPATPGGVDFYYPDLSTILFTENGFTTTYRRDGQIVLKQLPNVILFYNYKQKGARVFMSGFNELFQGGAGISVPYFGVILPSGDKMMVHSRDENARLPHYTNTNAPYGPNGSTPTILKN